MCVCGGETGGSILGHLAISGDISCCHRIWGVAGTEWEEARGTAKHTTRTK